jgi:hypothetical protein
LAAAVLISAIGVFGKEFAAVPLFVAALTWFQQRRSAEMRTATIGFLLVAAVWVAWMLTLRTVFDYNYGKSSSADLMGGG